MEEGITMKYKIGDLVTFYSSSLCGIITEVNENFYYVYWFNGDSRNNSPYNIPYSYNSLKLEASS